MLFVVDGSGSIGPQSFEDVRRFLRLMTDEVEVGFNDTNVGLVQFNEAPYTEFSIREYQSNDGVRGSPLLPPLLPAPERRSGPAAGIESMGWRNGRTMIGRALQHALDRELIREAGLHPASSPTSGTVTSGMQGTDPRFPTSSSRSRTGSPRMTPARLPSKCERSTWRHTPSVPPSLPPPSPSL